MRNIIFVSIISFVLGFGQAYAGPGGHPHSHGPISEKEVRVKAGKLVQNLIKRGTIDNSWNEKPVHEVTQKDFGKGPEWVVSFRNTSLKDKSKHTLYIFFKLDGHYLAANYTGE